MEKNLIEAIVQKQRAFFQTGKTLDVAFRIDMLKKLYSAVVSREEEIARALESDLGKAPYESFMCEIGLALTEISYMIRHVRAFARRKTARTPLSQFASHSFTVAQPYGNTLIMSPWNYPFLLTIEPLANAIAAGNTAVVKPSAYSPQTSAVVEKLLRDIFPQEYVAVVTGGRSENAALLDQKFDFIFFTGSTNVGKEVLRKAAEHVTPVVLELGGKSPCVVDSTATIPLAARRIVFGKFLNSGQTCVAPDYVWCDAKIRDALIAEIKKQIAIQNPDMAHFGKIVNEKHFARLQGLIDPKKIACGGELFPDKLQIAPTVLRDVTWDDAVMQEEIFGPILPVLTYENIGEVVEKLAELPKPLAMYIFSEDKATTDMLLERCRFGGGCVNDCIIHLATSEMPFGGVGESGMGAYHGKAGFDAFSHTKAIVDKKTWLDLPMRYRPYKKSNEKMIRKFLR